MDNPENAFQPGNAENKPPMFNPESSELIGVKGWLLLFCVGLTIISPLIRLSAIGAGIQAISTLGNQFPGLTTIIYVEILLNAATTAFSLYAGISLWMVKKNAVKIVKVYLISLIVVAVIDVLMLLVVKAPEEAYKAGLTAALIGVAQSVIYSAVWYAYLRSSQRVRNTYRDSEEYQ